MAKEMEGWARVQWMYHTRSLDCRAVGRYTAHSLWAWLGFGKREQVHGGVGRPMDNHLLAFFVI
jgi:hypothetical protein